ncbi:BON domain-containing protein [Phenylobacterium terrae]|uniref:BON domain-containing protein n=1 Tax=Phenylobacterium terrae TaxID=2665495 RepID=A0ABW4N366_9CAUL
MPRQEFWNRHRGRERSWDPRDLREDYGQADYSRDYAFDRRRRVGYRTEARTGGREDFGQADYSRDYEYDPQSRSAVRREEMRDERRHHEIDVRGYRANERPMDRDRRYGDEDRGPERRLDDPRTWFGGGRDRDRDEHYDERRARGRYDPDERIWRDVCDRLEDDRHLDARDIEVDVRGGEVTLRGMVEDRDQKRRAEDLAEVAGVVDVHNHLTIRNRYAGEHRGSSWRRSFGLSG